MSNIAMKEYLDGRLFNPTKRVLPGKGTINREYRDIHRRIPILCHDAFVRYKDGFLLVKRKDEPAKDEWYPVGGRVERGYPVEQSLIRKVKSEVGLDISNIQLIGIARAYFKSDPFNHNFGTDTPTLVYFADGSGEIKLDNHHLDYRIVKNQDVHNLSDFVQDFMFEATKTAYWRDKNVEHSK